MSVDFFPFVNKESHCILNIAPLFQFSRIFSPCRSAVGWLQMPVWRTSRTLKALTLLNPSQNGNLTDKTLELISGLGYNFVVLSMCIYQDIVLVSIVASVDRPDHAGVVESVQLPGVQLGPPPPETTAGPALRILESCRVTAASEMPRSISSRCSLSPTWSVCGRSDTTRTPQRPVTVKQVVPD